MRDPCPTCHRPMPATKLQLWMAQHGHSYQTLSDALGANTRNWLWRMDHGDKPQKSNRSMYEQLLYVTGLSPEDLDNPKPGELKRPGQEVSGG